MTVSLDDSTLTIALLQYYIDVAKTIQYRMLEEQLLGNEAQVKASGTASSSKQDEKSRLDFLKKLSLNEFLSLFDHYNFEKVKDLSKEMQEKFRGAKD